MTCAEAAAALRAKCEHAQRLDLAGEPIERALVEVLQWLKGNPDCRPDFVQVLLSILDAGPDSLDVPWELLPFCMRELRWPEILEATTRLLDDAVARNDWRTHAFFSKTREAYEPDWEDASLFDYYQT